MSKLKELTRPVLSWMFGLAFCIFTGMRIIPAEAFVGVATACIIWWFKSRDEEKQQVQIKELERLVKK